MAAVVDPSASGKGVRVSRHCAKAFRKLPQTEVAVRLLNGEGKPGAFTPAAAFGPDLAVTAGGTWL
ncbi:hypothetical protein [Actinoplanes sp. HUAS TT8]|uniref:hypothetical protein n=1 Tax=Actinoplanes sp. HUAS TT8 TaxID=3447453 RepID=UPI003F524AD8